MIHCITTNKQELAIDLYKEWYPQANPARQLTQDSFLVAIYDEQEIIGAAILIIIRDLIFQNIWGLVENVYVKKEYRKNGIGKKLMKEVETQGRFWGCSFLKLTSSKPEGQALYRSLGYKEGLSFKKEL